MQVNGGINKELLESIQIPSHKSSEIIFYNKLLVEKMIKLASGEAGHPRDPDLLPQVNCDQ